MSEEKRADRGDPARHAFCTATRKDGRSTKGQKPKGAPLSTAAKVMSRLGGLTPMAGARAAMTHRARPTTPLSLRRA